MHPLPMTTLPWLAIGSKRSTAPGATSTSILGINNHESWWLSDGVRRSHYDGTTFTQIEDDLYALADDAGDHFFACSTRDQ